MYEHFSFSYVSSICQGRSRVCVDRKNERKKNERASNREKKRRAKVIKVSIYDVYLCSRALFTIHSCVSLSLSRFLVIRSNQLSLKDYASFVLYYTKRVF